MPRHIDARIRVPVNKLGEFIDDLPPWAELRGVERLAELNGDGGDVTGDPPPRGTTADALFARIKRYPGKTRAEHFRALNGKYKNAALSSALYSLQRRRLIKRSGSLQSATWEALND